MSASPFPIVMRWSFSPSHPRAPWGISSDDMYYYDWCVTVSLLWPIPAFWKVPGENRGNPLYPACPSLNNFYNQLIFISLLTNICNILPNIPLPNINNIICTSLHWIYPKCTVCQWIIRLVPCCILQVLLNVRGLPFDGLLVGGWGNWTDAGLERYSVVCLGLVPWSILLVHLVSATPSMPFPNLPPNYLP